MLERISLRALLIASLALPIAGCSNPLVIGLAVSPSSQSITVGQTAQFTATGTYGHGNGTKTTQDVSSQVTWTSSVPAVAAISSSGLATAVASGTTTITASMNGFNGNASSSASLVVSGSGVGGGTTPTSDVTSITVIPNAQTVASPGGTAQFIPIGTTSAGTTVNLTGLVAWASSSNQIATVNSAGLATGAAQGSATVTAVYTNSDKTVATGTATFQVNSGSSEQVTAMSLFPNSQSATALAQQTQFTALGTENGGQFDVTSQVAWSSSNTAVATVSATGMVTAAGAGSSTIEAIYTNKDGSKVIATASYSVSTGSAAEPLLSINVVPASTTVSNKGMTGQYLAFGTFSTPPLVRDITNKVTWLSLLPEVASINTSGVTGEIAGLATSQGYTGSTVIYAEDTTSNPDGTVVLSNPQTFTCKDPVTNVCIQTVPTPQFATITVFVEGENTSATGEYVTAPSDTGTPNLIHCGPDWTGSGGQVCTGTYAVGSVVKLTENLPANSTYFGGWSSGSNCAESSPATSTTCTVTLTGNSSVGVIFY